MSDQNKKPGTLSLIFTAAVALPSLILSELASRTSINRVTVETSTIVKRRVWFSELLRIPGNLILRCRRAPVFVLSKSDWHDREKQLANAKSTHAGLLIDRLDGVPLSEYLASEDSAEEKLAAVSTAMRSLFDFHLRFDQSHGDASSTNVMIHEFEGHLSATWFDFDVAHDESVPEVIRRADDLRALLYTSKPWLKNEEFVTLFPEWNSFYADDDIWNELLETMSKPLQHCDIFHLAQQKRAKATQDESS